MNIKDIILFSLGVSLDAFAVSISLGNVTKDKKLVYAVIIGLFFGFFQMIMPIIGFKISRNYFSYLFNFSNIISFIIFSLIGIEMIIDSFSKKEIMFLKLGFFQLLILSIATSLDALAIGVAISFSIENIFLIAVLFFLVTFVTSFIGNLIGGFIGSKYSFKSKLIGGIIFLIIGIKSII